MRVLIQSTTTHQFFVNRETVTQNPDEAWDFLHSSKALLFIKQNRMTQVQIVLKFPKTSDDINLEILELLERENRKQQQNSFD